MRFYDITSYELPFFLNTIAVNTLWLSDAIWRHRSGFNIGSGDGLLPDCSKPLHVPEPMLNLSSVRYRDIHLRGTSHDDVIKCKHFRVTGPLFGEFTSHRWIHLKKPAMWSLTVFLDLRPNKRLCRQSRRRWFETPRRSLWRPFNDKRYPGHQSL